jgi:uncharacterized protein
VKLTIANNLVLGSDFVTSTQAILAKKRVGKSYTAQKEAEELLEARQQIVVLDPTDAWWGLRSSSDGKSAGYAITIFGGRHGDVPIDASSGAQLASAIVHERFSAVVSLKLFSKTERLRFAADFLETLYRENREAVHLFLDEADTFVPQTPKSKEQVRCMEAADELVRRGGIDGVGITLISQRAAVVNKDVLSQVDRLIVLRIIARPDIEQVTRWMSVHGTDAQRKELESSLPSLPRGAAWIWTPEEERFRRIQILPKRTFDSGRTPKAGEHTKPPKVLAKVDLERLGAKMAETVQRQRENDPTELKKQVVALRRELERVGKGQDRAEANEKTNHSENIELRSEVARLREQLGVRQKPLLPVGDVARLEKVVARAEAMLAKQDAAVSRHHEAYQVALESHTKTSKSIVSAALVAIDDLRSKISRVPQHAPSPPSPSSRPARSTPPSSPSRSPGLPKISNGASRTHVTPSDSDSDRKPSPAQLRILTALAWWEGVGVDAPDLVGVAFVAGTSASSSSFENNRSWLRARGYVEYPSSGRAQLTPVGRSHAPPPSLPTTNEALHAVVFEKISPAVGRLLRGLIEVYPREISFEAWAAVAGTTVSSSSFENNRSWLRARGLAAYPRAKFARATDLLFPEAS